MPWPLLTLIVERPDMRGHEDIWHNFKTLTYTVTTHRQLLHSNIHIEYIDQIAQYRWPKQLCRITPSSSPYNSQQMNYKDAGVCGTECQIAMNMNLATGLPTARSGQPGHCMAVETVPNLRHGGRVLPVEIRVSASRLMLCRDATQFRSALHQVEGR